MEVGPKIESFYSSLIRGRFASSWWDLIALIKPVFVQARLLVHACVCVPVRMHSCVPALWIRQILGANNGALCLRQDYSPELCQL